MIYILYRGAIQRHFHVLYLHLYSKISRALDFNVLYNTELLDISNKRFRSNAIVFSRNAEFLRAYSVVRTAGSVQHYMMCTICFVHTIWFVHIT